VCVDPIDVESSVDASVDQLPRLLVFCSEPKTLAQIEEAGFTKRLTYNAVKTKKLVNLNRAPDANGVKKHGGLFQNRQVHEAGKNFALNSVWR
jgi:hypothetical protein